MDFLTQILENPAFSQISADQLKQFSSSALSRSYQKNEFVTHRGDVWPYLIFIQSGIFEAIKESGQGRTFVVETFQDGEFFWGIALFSPNKENPVAIRASNGGKLLLWHREQIETMIANNPHFAWSIIWLMAEKMARVSKILDELAFLPLASRLANLLLDQSQDIRNGYISRDLTLDDMAARVGTTREMVCKLLYNFSDQGVIELERTQFKITDHDKLTSLAVSSK